jgi:2-methylcitrate dehydratase PrpD
MQATERLAEFITDLTYDTCPPEVVAAAKIGILDGMANMLAGSTQPLTGIINQYMQQMGGAPDCSVVGQDYKTNPPAAAFVNGVALHCLDFEIQGAPPTHGTSACLPPALALGEMVAASGKRLLEAYVLGWELQGRFRAASAGANLRGFHPPGIFGPIGAVAAAAKVLGLDRQQVRMALGIAASRTGGLTANTGTMVKSTHPGAAARHGVEAALLARAGFVSHDSVIEARQGYVEVLFGDGFDWELLTRDLGHAFQLVDPGFNIKRYPAQIYMQWPIEAVLTLRQKYNLKPEDIDDLEIEIPGRSDRARPQPRSGLDGKFSFEYCAAVALAEGQITIDSFSDATRFTPGVEAMLRKVRLRMNPDIPMDIRRTWAVARVKTADGHELSERCQNYCGCIANPMSREEHVGKVQDCARRVLNPADVARLIDSIDTLEHLSDLRPLMHLVSQRSAA